MFLSNSHTSDNSNKEYKVYFIALQVKIDYAMYKQRLRLHMNSLLSPMLLSHSVHKYRECNPIQLHEMTPEHKGLRVEGDGWSLPCLESKAEQNKAAVEGTPNSSEMEVLHTWRPMETEAESFPSLLQWLRPARWRLFKMLLSTQDRLKPLDWPQRAANPKTQDIKVTAGLICPSII